VKILPVGAYLFYADGQTDTQTDVTELIVAHRNFVNALETCRKVFMKHSKSNF